MSINNKNHPEFLTNPDYREDAPVPTSHVLMRIDLPEVSRDEIMEMSPEEHKKMIDAVFADKDIPDMID